jgi:biotin carboxylase
MKTIVFLGSHKSGSSYEAIRAADEMGYYTVLLTNRPSTLGKRMEYPHAHSVRMCDLDDPAALMSAVDRLAIDRFEICAIVSFIDPYCLSAAKLSKECGLPGFSQEAIAAMLDKIKTRQLLKGTPYSPFFLIADTPGHMPKTSFPLVLKSPVSTGSKDVYPVHTAQEYLETFQKLKEQYPGIPVLAEKYIDGPQVLVETLTVEGRTHIAAVVEQEVTFTGRFIITGYRVASGGEALTGAVDAVIKLFGMENGSCHLEMKRGQNGWILIEANPRISGGAMNTLIETATGVDLAAQTLRLALGAEPCFTPKHRKEVWLQYVTVPEGGVLERVTGKTAAQNSPGVERVYVKPRKGTLLHPPTSMGHRYAYVIASGDTAEEAMMNAKSAAGRIRFHLR